MMDPFDNGTGFGFYLILPFTYKFGLGIAVGGSGALADALVRCFEDHGGTIRLNSEIERILLDGQTAKGVVLQGGEEIRSEEHTSELQSLMRISYAVFCLKKK